ncbi:hypothetical protein HDU97_006322 [Phlyctochytrium planicorne]|nr:hypothetical protein HDU97_006322 [Phlyctochytrium planicorne]
MVSTNSLQGTITKNAAAPRVMDKLKVEQERGITVKAQTASMFYTHTDGKEYLINLVDTPGHVDFSYEVSRSLAACQGTILLVDAAQGIQAQTVSNFFLAFGENLAIVPVLNKIDLPGAEPERVAQQIESAFEIPAHDILHISAKTGINVGEVLKHVVEKIPPPPRSSVIDSPVAEGEEMIGLSFRGLLFDSWYDPYVGVVCLVAVRDGIVRKGDRVTSVHTKQSYEVNELGLMHPAFHRPSHSLHAGQVGYLFLGMKTTRDANIGDTFYITTKDTPPASKPSQDAIPFHPHPILISKSNLQLPGFRPAKSVVFSGVYPYDASEHPRLREALDRLTLNDASVTVAHETSTALGQGFRLGFLGTLHMDVFSQRLEEEHDAVVINTAPTVSYKVAWDRDPVALLGPGAIVDADGKEKNVSWIRNPAEFPEPEMLGNVKAFYEPMVIGTLIFPKDYLGTMMDLCGSHRGEQLEYTFIDESRVMLKYKLPMAEILTDFYDQLKSRTQGYASFDYEEIGYEEADLVKVNLLLNSKPVDALATICHRSQGERVAKDWVKKLKGVMDRQLVEIVIQAAINGRIVAREGLSALRKDVTAKLYGGDITRKMKLLEKQKVGKKRMKSVAGGIQLPQELEKFQKAFKNEEFRNLFSDFVKEISDPVNRERYEKEIQMLEAERGNDIRWVKPNPWKVIKTKYVRPPDPVDVSKEISKVFVNVCSSTEIANGTSKKVKRDGKVGESWSIPYSLSSPRVDSDNANKECMVYDCVFNPKMTEKGNANPAFADLLFQTAAEGIEKQFAGVKLSREWKVLRLPYKGEPKSTVIRNKSNDKPLKGTSLEFLEKLQQASETPSSSSTKPAPAKSPASKPSSASKLIQEISSTAPTGSGLPTPTFNIVHRGVLSYQTFTNEREKNLGARPEYIVVKIQMPLVLSAAELEVDTTLKEVVLAVPGKYEKLTIALPFEVDSENGRAKFDKRRKELEIELPVIPAPKVQLPESDAPFEDEAEVEADIAKAEALLKEYVSESPAPQSSANDPAITKANANEMPSHFSKSPKKDYHVRFNDNPQIRHYEKDDDDSDDDSDVEDEEDEELAEKEEELVDVEEEKSGNQASEITQIEGSAEAQQAPVLVEGVAPAEGGPQNTERDPPASNVANMPTTDESSKELDDSLKPSAMSMPKGKGKMSLRSPLIHQIF